VQDKPDLIWKNKFFVEKQRWWRHCPKIKMMTNRDGTSENNEVVSSPLVPSIYVEHGDPDQFEGWFTMETDIADLDADYLQY
jgi:hypothetical protein